MSSTFFSRCCSFLVLVLGIGFSLCDQADAQTEAPVRVAVVGLVHGHIDGFLGLISTHSEVTLVGIAEPDVSLQQKYKTRFHLADNLFFSSEEAMLKSVHPQAVLVYTSVAGHRAAIEQAARYHVASMVEKPLSTTLADALAIQHASEEWHVPVLVNYETTWYASNVAAHQILADGRIGALRKVVVHDGHKGPKEIGVPPEFLNWLTDPQQNGAGALFDFGCYGVDLTTWLMHGELPLTVTARTLQIKPDVYPKVDDDSTIVLTYPHAQAIMQGSWNWPFDRKDMEVYGATGYVDTVKKDGLRVRFSGESDEQVEKAQPLQAPQDDPLHYLVAVLNGHLQPKGDLSSLDTNVTVMRILDAARESARTGRTISLRSVASSHAQ
jgi:glucose-fructose oxidoreductase